MKIEDRWTIVHLTSPDFIRLTYVESGYYLLNSARREVDLTRYSNLVDARKAAKEKNLELA